MTDEQFRRIRGDTLSEDTMFQWNQDGVRILSRVNAHFIRGSAEVVVSGYMQTFRGEGGPTMLDWTATVTPNGWYVTINGPIGRIGEYQGATFNLLLEVATAARRLV